MPPPNPEDFASFYQNFNSPITRLDCGNKCAPYNEHGVPFCCDTRHTIPTAYQNEWEYLQANTGLWHLFQPNQPQRPGRILSDVPDGQVMIECQGHKFCQRNFRSITCRSFPFFPYITRQDEFIGMTYYWAYADRCWVISHLSEVRFDYVNEFISTFEALFERMPDDRENFRHYSSVMRRHYGRLKKAIPLLHRNGKYYKITPRNGHKRRVSPESFPKFDPYRIADRLPFADE